MAEEVLICWLGKTDIGVARGQGTGVPGAIREALRHGKYDRLVLLLRVLQENEVTPVGESHPINVDVRVIAATHRPLAREVHESRFREDLFYRLALIYQRKKLSPGARNLLLQQAWRGNVREVHHTLPRATIWSDGETISRAAMVDDLKRGYLREALQLSNKAEAAPLLNLGSHQTFDTTPGTLPAPGDAGLRQTKLAPGGTLI